MAGRTGLLQVNGTTLTLTVKTMGQGRVRWYSLAPLGTRCHHGFCVPVVS
jgi:hypothetical protein